MALGNRFNAERDLTTRTATTTFGYNLILKRRKRAHSVADDLSESALG